MTDPALIEKAVTALLSERTLRGAAKKCNVSPKTLQRLRKTEEFQAAFRAAKVELVHASITALTAHSGKAADCLAKIFSDRKASPGARVAAAVQTLRLTLEGYELSELEQRIVELEKQKTNATF